MDKYRFVFVKKKIKTDHYYFKALIENKYSRRLYVIFVFQNAIFF